MNFTFRGVRGSIPCPGPDTVKYGGNTTCIEVRTDDNEIIILDAGTGIFPLAQLLLAELPLQCYVFISHSHWDHIQGLPFFTPLFIPGNTVRIHGGSDPITQRDISEVLSRQMEYAYFPIREAELNAQVEYITLKDRQIIKVGESKVENFLMCHPAIDFGYKISCGDKSLFFTGDHEWPYNIYDKEDEDYADFEEQIQQHYQSIIEFIRGVDVLIIDAAYTDEEYPAKQGWGHGTFSASIKVARDAGVKHCYFTHHEPTRSDDALEYQYQLALEKNAVCKAPDEPKFHLAREGVTIEI